MKIEKKNFYEGPHKKIFNEEKIYLIVDENTIQHIGYLEEKFLVTSTHLKLESGEKNKTFNSVLKIYINYKGLGKTIIGEYFAWTPGDANCCPRSIVF